MSTNRNTLTIKSTANSLQTKPLSHQTGAWVAVYRQSFPAIASNTTTSAKPEDPLPASSSVGAAPDDPDAPYVDSSKKAVVALKHRGGGNPTHEASGGKANQSSSSSSSRAILQMKKTDLSLQLVQRELRHRVLEEKLNFDAASPGDDGFLGVGAGILSDDAENA